ncbi:MAG TPA: DUF1801 domain-containing protein [Candidatus Dormibacteraeota bacterium]|nr:DUF1801 domain-containing protein [Candidatus Dormibacteraeota bacterium]
MASTAQVTPSVSAQVNKVPARVRPIVRAAIRAVKDAAPNAKEIPYAMEQPRSSRMMWKLARYAIGGANVVGVGTFGDHSTLFFYRGRELDDGSGLLQGSGKDSRFVTLRSASDAERPEVRRLIRNAFKVGGPR